MSLCNVCENLVLQPKAFKRACGSKRQSLGNYDEILRKANDNGLREQPEQEGCGGCAFFCDVLQGSQSWRERHEKLEGKLVFLDSSRLDVRWPERAGGSSYAVDDLMLDLYSDEFIEHYEPPPTDAENDATEEGEKDEVWVNDCNKDTRIDCKRVVPVDPRDDMCFGLLRSWLAACSMHEQCAGMTPVLMPKRVIEIPDSASETPRLLATNGELEQYVVLSHCWGGADPAGKLKDSLISRYQQGLDLDQLPQNIRDAVHITRRLGFRYLWVDALCICQDDAEDWAEEKAKLSLYYGHAALMISASTATDANSGILAERYVPMSPIMGKERKFGLRQRILRWKDDIERSQLSTRGWAAQERMLAPRIVHYTRRQMIWECAAGLSFEASGIDDGDFGRDPLDTYFSKAKLQPLLTAGLGGLHPGISDDTESDSDEQLARRLYAWLQCVYEYSHRNISVSSDKLPAIAGLATTLNHDGTMGDYLAGIWSKDLAAGLAWSRPWRLLSTPPAYQAPSWSWAGVNGGVSHAVLGSTHKILLPQPPPTTPRTLSTDGEDAAICYRWTAELEPKLIDHHILLEDPAQPYGAVLGGSYLVVEGTCLGALELPKLRDVMLEEGWALDNNPIVVLDKSSAFDCPCCHHRPSSSADEENNNNTSTEGEKTRNEAHFDFCMILFGDVQRKPPSYVNLLALRWVDRETRMAERVGLVAFQMWKGNRDDVEAFREAFRAADTERMTLKLV
ncbi:heterokaryon incompatibility protein-domain-containing protein [Apiospora arundinis]